MSEQTTAIGNQKIDGSAIAISCFMASFLLEGLQRCTGVLFSGTLELSDETRQTAAVPFVVSRATAYIISVVAKNCFLSRKPESWLLFGTLLCALGAGLCFICNDDIWLTVCWGVVFGAGIGVAFPESLKVSQKYHGQTLLTIFKSAAPCFSCILMPHLMLFLVSSFGLGGCFLILSGIILNAVPFILIANHNIPFYLWKPNWRIRKKYGANHDTDKSKDKGVDNDAFESEDCEQPNAHVPSTSNHESNRTDIREQVRNDSVSSQLSNKSPNMKPNFQGLDEVIRKLGRDPESVVNVTNTVADEKLFENSFSEEDILFEVTSEIPKKQSSSVGGVTNSEILRTDANFRDDNLQSKKRTLTIINPINDTLVLETKTNSSKSLTNKSNAEILKQADAISLKKASFISSKNVNDTPTIHSLSQNFLVTKTPLSPLNGTQHNFPLEIKVHVVECTFTANEFQKNKLLEKSFQNTSRNGYRKHSNSLITTNYDNVDFNSPNFAKKYRKSSTFSRHPTNPNSRMYLISEDDEFNGENNSCFSRSNGILNESREQKLKSKWLSSLKKITKPSCLVIIYACVIYEITLITLLTIFDDLVTDAGIDGATAVGVLPAFGLGGIVGRLSLRYFGDRLLVEGSHATAAVLFILDGAVVAGILWSPNLYWIAGFYALLGFLEVSISTTVCNLVSDYIDEEVESRLFSICTFFCGICILFVPCTIGMSRDDLGEYDGLLQITSGLSVLCAVLCYILPRFANYPRHMRGS